MPCDLTPLNHLSRVVDFQFIPFFFFSRFEEGSDDFQALYMLDHKTEILYFESLGQFSYSFPRPCKISFNRIQQILTCCFVCWFGDIPLETLDSPAPVGKVYAPNWLQPEASFGYNPANSLYILLPSVLCVMQTIFSLCLVYFLVLVVKHRVL